MMLIGLLALLLAGVGVLIKFYLDERDSRVLAEQIAHQNDKIMVEYGQEIEKQIDYYTLEIDHLGIKFDSARRESNEFRKKLAAYDLEKEARAQPRTLEEKVNAATAKLFTDIENASRP